MLRTIPVLTLLVLAGSCTAIRQQKTLPAVPDSAEHRNLQVLSPNMSRDQLIAVMRGFTRELDVRCDHCHVRLPGGGERDLDFASDAKPQKNVARTMLRMTRAINTEFISQLNPDGQQVTCMTCHRGRTIPEVVQASAE